MCRDPSGRCFPSGLVTSTLATCSSGQRLNRLLKLISMLGRACGFEAVRGCLWPCAISAYGMRRRSGALRVQYTQDCSHCCCVLTQPLIALVLQPCLRSRFIAVLCWFERLASGLVTYFACLCRCAVTCGLAPNGRWHALSLCEQAHHTRTRGVWCWQWYRKQQYPSARLAVDSLLAMLSVACELQALT